MRYFKPSMLCLQVLRRFTVPAFAGNLCDKLKNAFGIIKRIFCMKFLQNQLYGRQSEPMLHGVGFCCRNLISNNLHGWRGIADSEIYAVLHLLRSW